MSGKSRIIYIVGGLTGVTVAVLAGLYAYGSYERKPEQAVNADSSVRNPSSRPDGSKTDDKSYQRLITEYNKQGKQTARVSGDSFVGQPATPPQITAADNNKDFEFEKKNNVSAVSSSSAAPAEDNMKKLKLERQRALLAKIEETRQKSSPDSIMKPAVSYDVKTDVKPGAWAVSVFTGMQENQGTTAENGSRKGQNPERGLQLIAGLSTFPAVVDTAVNSDNTRMKMVAHIVSGKLKGAQLYSSELALAGDGIEVKFSQMQWNGAYYRIEAYAVETSTNEFAVASEVNNRWFSRILLPAIANGIGQTGQLYKDSNSKVIIGNSGTEYRSTDSPDGKAVAGTIAGGIGEQAAKVLEQDAAKLPVKQVKVDARKIIGIQFITPIYSTDKQQ